MLTSLTVKVAISSEDVEEIVVTSGRIGKDRCSSSPHVVPAARRGHALD